MTPAYPLHRGKDGNNTYNVRSAAFDDETASQIDQLAALRSQSRSELIRSAVVAELQTVTKSAGSVEPDRESIRAALEASVREHVSKSGADSRLTAEQRDAAVDAGVDVLIENIERVADLQRRVDDPSAAQNGGPS